MLDLPDDVRQSRLISDEYRRLQQQMHTSPDYGTASIGYAPIVAQLIEQNGITQLLDYGAGKGNLFRTLRDQKLLKNRLRVQHYDPAIPDWAEMPEPTEMVVCLDVLEHIEPDLLDNVLDDLQRVTGRIGIFSVAVLPAKKVLPDGRNAHLILEPESWWLPKIMERFELQVYQKTQDGFFVIVTPLILEQ